MKNRILKYLSVLAAVLLVSSCEWTPPLFNSADSFVAYTSASSNIAEQGSKVGIPVLVTAGLDAAAVTVTFEFDDASTAIEGVHFSLVNDSKTLNVTQGWGYDTVWIQPIDNDEFTGNLKLMINLVSNSKNYPFGVMSVHTATIVDNEHPLGAWIGSYTVDAQSYGNPENWDEVWSVSTEPDPEDVNNLIITILQTPYGGPGEPFIATIDKEAMSITIAPGTWAGSIYGYADGMTITHSDYNTFVDPEAPIVGTVEADGTILIDEIGMVNAGAGWIWDAFDTTWDKTGKKSTKGVEANPDKSSRF